MARTGPFRMAWRQRSVSAVRDKVEHFEYDLSDQDLAPDRAAHKPFFAALVRVDDGSPSPSAGAQLRRDLVGDHETRRRRWVVARPR